MFLCHPTLFGSMRSLSDAVSGRNVLLRGCRRCGMNAMLAGLRISQLASPSQG